MQHNQSVPRVYTVHNEHIGTLHRVSVKPNQDFSSSFMPDLKIFLTFSHRLQHMIITYFHVITILTKTLFYFSAIFEVGTFT